MFIVVVSAVVLLAFAVHGAISFGIGFSSAASGAPKQFSDAVVDAVAWDIEHKEGITLVLIVCLIVLYSGWNPSVASLKYVSKVGQSSGEWNLPWLSRQMVAVCGCSAARNRRSSAPVPSRCGKNHAEWLSG